MVHDIMSVKDMSYELFKKNITTDILIYGHTHKMSIEVYQKTLFINSRLEFPPVRREKKRYFLSGEI